MLANIRMSKITYSSLRLTQIKPPKSKIPKLALGDFKIKQTKIY